MSFIILQAEEDQEDRDERWDPDSDMEVDEERYFILYLVSILFYLFNPQDLNFCFPLAFWTENPSRAELKKRQLNLKSKIRYVLIEYSMSNFCSCPINQFKLPFMTFFQHAFQFFMGSKFF